MLRCFYGFGWVVILVCLSQNTLANDFSEFLRTKAVPVDSLEFVRSKHEFLNYRVEKGRAKWFEGSIVTNEDTRFDQLKLKFNVLYNSLYINFNEVIYRVPSFSLKEFEITQKGKSMTFRKGYALSFRAKIRAVFNGSIQELNTYLNTYPEFQNISIEEMSFSGNEMIELNISLKTASRDQVSKLKRYIDSNNKTELTEFEYDVTEIGVNTFLQVLYENDLFVVLKYHFKKSATTDAVSLVQISESFMIADEDYYLAGPDNQLVEFLFTKKSIENSLNRLNITSAKEIQNVGSESRALKWFRSSTFTTISE